MTLYRDAAFALKIHVVKHLRLQVLTRNRICVLK
jgi:hypothetical protein